MGQILLYKLSATCVLGIMCITISRAQTVRSKSSEIPILNCPKKKHFLQTKNNSTMCIKCSTCPAGYGVKSKCTMKENTTCRKCKRGFFSPSGAMHCKKCKICQGQYITVRRCTKVLNTKCKKCRHGRYLFKRTRSCHKCKQCQPGYYVHKQCSGKINTVCKKCPGGTFSETYGMHKCLTCRICGDNFITMQPCTGRMNTVCSPCQTGYFHQKTSGQCLQCSQCLTGFPGYTQEVEECSRNSNGSNLICTPLGDPSIRQLSKGIEKKTTDNKELLSLFMKCVIGGSALILLSVIFAITWMILNHRRNLKSIEKNMLMRQSILVNRNQENTASWVFRNSLSNGVRSSSAPFIYQSNEQYYEQHERSHSFSTPKSSDNPEYISHKMCSVTSSIDSHSINF